jgi:hypothetical protein
MFNFSVESTTISVIEMQIADYKMGYTLEHNGLEEPFLT